MTIYSLEFADYLKSDVFKLGDDYSIRINKNQNGRFYVDINHYLTVIHRRFMSESEINEYFSDFLSEKRIKSIEEII